MTTGNYSGSSMAAPPGSDPSTSTTAGGSGAKEQVKEQAAQVTGLLRRRLGTW